MKTAAPLLALLLSALPAAAELVSQSMGTDPLTRRIVSLASREVDGGIKTVVGVRGAGAVLLSPAADPSQPLAVDPALRPVRRKPAKETPAKRAKDQLKKVSQKNWR